MALTLSDDVYKAVTDLANEVGKPASKVVAELLEEMVPQLEGLAKVARAAKSGNQAAAKRALAHMMGDSMAEMLQDELFSSMKKKVVKK